MSNTERPFSAIEEVFHNYGRRRAALDYAFFKLNLPEYDVALLVDFIVRRRIGVAQVRVSVHAPLGGGVSLAEIPLDRFVIGSMKTPSEGAHIGDNWLGAVGSRGTVGTTVWDLAFQPASPVLSPQIKLIEPLHAFDLSLQSVPDVRFSGRLRIAGQRYEVSEARGAAYLLQCSASTGDYHDLGDRIQTTLLASCTLKYIASADRTVGLEERMPGRT